MSVLHRYSMAVLMLRCTLKYYSHKRSTVHMNTFFLFLLIFRASFPNITRCCVNISKKGTIPLEASNLKPLFLTLLLSVLPKMKIKYLHSEGTDHPVATMERGDIHFQGEIWSYSLFFHLHFNRKTFHSVPSEKLLYAFKWRLFFSPFFKNDDTNAWSSPQLLWTSRYITQSPYWALETINPCL